MLVFPKEQKASRSCALTTHLSVESYGTGLALGADPVWPGRVTLAARLDLTADVLQSGELPSAGRGVRSAVGLTGKPEDRSRP